MAKQLVKVIKFRERKLLIHNFLENLECLEYGSQSFRLYGFELLFQGNNGRVCLLSILRLFNHNDGALPSPHILKLLED